METSKVSTDKRIGEIKKINVGKIFFLKFLQNIQIGKLTLITPDGKHFQFGKTDDIHAKIEIKNTMFYSYCLNYGDVGFGEAYVNHYWDTNSIYDVIKIFILNLEHLNIISGSKKRIINSLLSVKNRIQHILRPNSYQGAKKNIAEHYDLSNDFFKLWLDETMTYSSGLWLNKNDNLHTAQINKWNRLIGKLQIKKSDKVLEIGTGWGGLALHLAKTVGCKIHTITISKEQYQYAKNLFHNQQINHLVTLELKDYREVEGQYDKIISFEMMEAIGHKYMPIFIKKVNSLLSKNGLFGTQIITCPDSRYKEFKNGIDWIQKHIFPGSLLLSVSHLQNLMTNHTTLQLFDMFDMGMHYEKTLLTWRENFKQNLKKVTDLGLNDSFIRKWYYYLDYCAAAFATRNISVVQVCFTRPNNSSLDV